MIFDHFQIVIVLPERCKVLLLLVEVLEQSLTNVDLLVDGGVLEQLDPEVDPTQGDVALGAGAGA